MLDPLPISISADVVEAGEVRDSIGTLVAPWLRGNARLVVVDLQPDANLAHWFCYLFIFELWGNIGRGGRETPMVRAHNHQGGSPDAGTPMVPLMPMMTGVNRCVVEPKPETMEEILREAAEAAGKSADEIAVSVSIGQGMDAWAQTEGRFIRNLADFPPDGKEKP